MTKDCESVVEERSAHVEFERLVAQVSSNFINLPPEAVDDAIRDALRRVGEMLHLDRCAFYSVREDGMLVDSVTWHRDGIPPGPVTSDAASSPRVSAASSSRRSSSPKPRPRAERISSRNRADCAAERASVTVPPRW